MEEHDDAKTVLSPRHRMLDESISKYTKDANQENI